MAVNWDKMSTMRDDELRPWASDDDEMEVLDAAYQALQTGFKRTAPMGKGGAFGISPLDRRPAVLNEIEELIRHPERFNNGHDEIQLKHSQRGTRRKGPPSNNPNDNKKEKMKSSSTRDLLRKATYFMSSALDGHTAKKVARNKKNPIKACYQLDSIRYDSRPNRGPAVFNMSTADYQKFLARLHSKGLNVDELLRSYMESQAAAEDDRDIYEDGEEVEEDYDEESKQTCDGVKDSQPVEETAYSEGSQVKPLPEALPLIRTTTAPTLESVTGGIFKGEPFRIQQQTKEGAGVPPRPSSARPASRAGSASSTRRDKKGADEEMSMAGPTPGSAGSSRSRPPTADCAHRLYSGWLKVEGAGVDDLKHAAPAPSPVAAPVRAATAAPNTAAFPLRPASASPRMNISREGECTLFAAPFAAPESDHASADKSSGAVGKAGEAQRETKGSKGGDRVHPLSGRVHTPVGSRSTPTGAVSASASVEGISIDPKTGNARILSHKRIKELKSLRALMMTTAGSVTLNVHPETSDDCVDETKRMKEVTQRCIQECIEKNHLDSAGPLLATPGFLETIGPSNFYISEGHRGYVYGERFQKALEETDHKHGIKMDPLRAFIENAAKNKQKIFKSEGVSFKM